MEKICLTINDNKSRSIAFQVTEEEKEIDIHIYTNFKEGIKVCVINPSNKRTKFISKNKKEIKNIVEDIKIKGEYFDFNEIASRIKIRIKITSKKDKKDSINPGIWKILFVPLEKVNGNINAYINYSNSLLELKDIMKMNRYDPRLNNIGTGFVVLYKYGFEEDLKKVAPTYNFFKISDRIGIVFGDVDFEDKNSVDILMKVLSIPTAERTIEIVRPNSLSIISHEISKGVNANEDIGVNFFKDNPNLTLSGKGVLIGVIDTGIDYLHPDFIYDDNTTKIAYLWDQSKEGNAPDGFYIGTEYDRDEINKAIKNKDNSLSSDDVGSGTMLAGIMAGMGKINKNYVGVAEDAELIVVKMGTIDGHYNNAMLNAGYDYIYKKAKKLQKPVVVNLGFGSNSFVGASNRNLTELTYFMKEVCLVNAAGNEGNTNTHNSGNILFKGDVKDIELEVDDNEENIIIEVWINKPDTVKAEIISPTGEPSKALDVSYFNTIVGKFDFESTFYSIAYIFPTFFSGQQRIIINLSNVKKGTWKIRLTGEYITNGIYNAYLQNRVLLKSGTKFTDTSPSTTINFPATYKDNITVGAYDTINNTLWPSSSRGYTLSNILKPDIVAPGVNIIAPYPGGGYATITGSAPAAAYTSGCIALLLQYNIVDENYPRLAYVQKLRTFIRGGATRFNNISYPNQSTGYGILNIKGTFNQLR